MRTLRYGTAEWRRYLAGLPRGAAGAPVVERAVAAILRAVRREGDPALVRLTARLDGVRLDPRRLRVPAREIRARARAADRRVVAALRAMAGQIEAYHRRQLEPGFRMRLADGSLLEEVVTPLSSVGLYVPGGAGAYPSSVLMNAIPARVAGVPRIAVVTPPRTLERSPAVAAAIVLAGLEDSVYRVGGAQAVAALAYGTPTVPAVDKIVGPGNAYVAAAKRQVRGQVEIDHDAGPSEVVVLADDTAKASLVAADLLAQAEHGSGGETVGLVTASPPLATPPRRLVAEGLPAVANRAATQRALRGQGAVVLVRDTEEGVAAVNAIAPEHVEVMTRRAGAVARRLVTGAGVVGPHAPGGGGGPRRGPPPRPRPGGAAPPPPPPSPRGLPRAP